MKLTKELFVIQGKDVYQLYPSLRGRLISNPETYTLYVPLKSKVMQVTGGVIDLLKKVRAGEKLPQLGILEKLVNEGIIVEQEESEPVFPHWTGSKFQPTSVTLFPTTNCNLRCIYCYSSAGDNLINLEREVAKAAIDFVINNALDTGQRTFSVTFHGGGEPFHYNVQNIVKRTVSYARNLADQKGLEGRFSGSTNGLLSPEMREWVVKNLDSVQVSIDGPEEIQNVQRPIDDGRPSFTAVMKTIYYFEEQRFKYKIRSTITKDSVERLPEIFDFFHRETSLKSFHFEPLSESGRCKTSNARAPDSKMFLEMFLKTRRKATENGINIFYSSGKIDYLGDTFCGASGKNFVVTSEGKVTFCYEVGNSSDPRARDFMYGYYSKEAQQFKFSGETIKRLSARTVGNISYCQDCFVKYNCGGDCPAKVALTGRDMFDPSNNSHCYINRGICLDELNTIMEEKKNE